MSLVEQLDAPAACSSSSDRSMVPTLMSFGQASAVSSAGGRGCWDSSGRVLCTQGVLQYQQQEGCIRGWDSLTASPSLVAIDFGSWHDRKQRWPGSSAAGSSSSSGGGGGTQESGDVEIAGAQSAGVQAGEGQETGDKQQLQQRWQGRIIAGQGGQVLHRELHWTAAATAVAAAGPGGEVLAGTRSGDVMWLG